MNQTLQQLRAAITEAIHGLTPEDLARHPQGKWCAAEILDHLNLTYMGTVKNLERCLRTGQTVASSDRSNKRWQRFFVTGLGLFPPGRKSPERARPRGLPPNQVTAEVLQNLARMEEVIRECETRFGNNRPIADHPGLGPLTVKEWRKFHVVHGLHHTKQILRLKQN
jgi:DinB superfamily